MIFELIKDWIWNIGGVFFSIMLMLVIINWIIEHFLIGWHKKNVRNNILYWLRHKKEIIAYIEKNNIPKKTKEEV